jgi:hypothetical protein
VTTFDVLFSHDAKDKPKVRELKQVLLQHGSLRCWLDENDLRPGLDWKDGLEDGDRLSRSVAVLMGSGGLGSSHKKEMKAALIVAADDERPIIPV